MNDDKDLQTQAVEHDHHADGKRCCGRTLDQKCSPEQEAANINPLTGHKHCCRNKTKQ